MNSIGVSGEKTQEFVIVKNANDQKWHLHFLEDPRIVGVRRHFSAYFSFDGRFNEIDVTYTNLEKARCDMERLLSHNPNGAYDICPVY